MFLAEIACLQTIESEHCKALPCKAEKGSLVVRKAERGSLTFKSHSPLNCSEQHSVTLGGGDIYSEPKNISCFRNAIVKWGCLQLGERKSVCTKKTKRLFPAKQVNLSRFLAINPNLSLVHIELWKFKEDLCRQLLIETDGARIAILYFLKWNHSPGFLWNHPPGFLSLENIKYQVHLRRFTLLLTHFVGKSLIRRTAPCFKFYPRF